MEKDELKKLIAKSLGIDSSKIDDNSSQGNVMEWDSLGQLSILSALDAKLEGKAIDLTLMSDKMSVNDLFEAIQKQIQKT
jgi:acyl carrier protein